MMLTFRCAVASGGGEGGVVVLVWVRSGWECFRFFDEPGRLLCEEGREEGLGKVRRSIGDYLSQERSRCVMCAETFVVCVRWDC
jgi:hypothetical protein